MACQKKYLNHIINVSAPQNSAFYVRILRKHISNCGPLTCFHQFLLCFFLPCIFYIPGIVLSVFNPNTLKSSLLYPYVFLLYHSQFVYTCPVCYTQLTGNKQHLLPHLLLDFHLKGVLKVCSHSVLFARIPR